MRQSGPPMPWRSHCGIRASTRGPTSDAIRQWGNREYGAVEHYKLVPLGIALLYEQGGDIQTCHRILDTAEGHYLHFGLWHWALAINFAAGRLDRVEQIARDVDELECAILAYEGTGQHADAACLYEEIGRAGRSHDTAGNKTGTSSPRARCQNCGAEVQPHWVVCPECNADLQVVACRHCGEPLKPHWSQCPACRTPVAG